MKKVDFFKNVRLKLLALALAIVLWFSVGMQKEAEVGFLIPLQIKSIPEGMVLRNTPREMIELRLSGPTGIINNLSLGEVSVEVALDSASAGSHDYTIRPSDVSLPRGIEIEKIFPDRFSIELTEIEPTEEVVEEKTEEGPGSSPDEEKVTAPEEKPGGGEDNK